ncbi:hypothetical protein Tco_0440228, partial [Tanacetum coccineum]
NSVNSPEPTLSSRPTKVEVPKELPKVGMVNTSLKKLIYHGMKRIFKKRNKKKAKSKQIQARNGKDNVGKNKSIGQRTAKQKVNVLLSKRSKYC